MVGIKGLAVQVRQRTSNRVTEIVRKLEEVMWISVTKKNSVQVMNGFLL